jgi:hypothetical protein
MEGNPAYLELRRIEVAKDVSDVISKSANRVYVRSDNLLMGLGAEASNKLFGAGKWEFDSRFGNPTRGSISYTQHCMLGTAVLGSGMNERTES